MNKYFTKQKLKTRKLKANRIINQSKTIKNHSFTQTTNKKFNKGNKLLKKLTEINL